MAVKDGIMVVMCCGMKVKHRQAEKEQEQREFEYGGYCPMHRQRL
jgi:hypothetical protein